MRKVCGLALFGVLVCFVPSPMNAADGAADKPPAPPVAAQVSKDETIAHLNDVIALLAAQNASLRAQLDEAKSAPALMDRLRAHIAAMRTDCEKSGQALAANPQTGLFLPDAKGQPYCVPIAKSDSPSPTSANGSAK